MVPMDADVVIATNFPSYFVRHDHKVVWLFHQHRGAYDALDAPWTDIGSDDESSEVQRMLTEWDARALGEAERIFTLSHVVTSRLERFNGLSGTPLYHPPPLHDRLRAGSYGDYVFTPTRLEANKRPDRVVDAVAASTSGVRGIVAGRGSLQRELQSRAYRRAPGRFELAGFVSDDRLVELYADALAVVYAPHDEDYGYVTLQAFCSGKPVITSTDAGGVLEWVEDGVTGIVTDGSPEQMGAAIDELAADRALAARLGAAGHERVRELSWGAVVDQLVRA
jgi:glycosyltransferase involved in cell wall biosynthesis